MRSGVWGGESGESGEKRRKEDMRRRGEGMIGVQEDEEKGKEDKEMRER